MTDKLKAIAASLQGDFFFDDLMRTLYATDASMFREWPLAVAMPKDAADIKVLIEFARLHKVSLIPRTAGTSLAGQCVGSGIAVDVSRYMNRILEVNPEERWVWVQPGVIRDELNNYLKPYGLHFGPNTATANRCMIGGMVGNNSCGSTSIVYGSTREHVLQLNTILSDGSEARFHSLTQEQFHEKTKAKGLEGEFYRQIHSELSRPERQEAIRANFPKPEIHRRNTGYAVDILLNSNIFSGGGEDFNFCKMLCGSEGTLAFTTEIKLNLVPLPDPEEVVVAAHFSSIRESLEAAVITMKHSPYACELMDRAILDCTKSNIKQRKNRFFLEGDPAAILMIELRGSSPAEAEAKADTLIEDLKSAGKGYTFPKVYAPHTKSVWALRAAGLGLLSNIPGDKKAVECIEDTAVTIEDLPDYIGEFADMMEGFGQGAVYYAHAGAGELHLRPILDLKTHEGVRLFREISESSARLVKKYNGSLSGEHGDGRVRSEFIPIMLGEQNMELLRNIKNTWDPELLLNPGKILDAPPMNTSLRYSTEKKTTDFNTIFDYTESQGILRMAEKCSGSADCRKLPMSGGTMCPSYMATRNEKHTTRARANALREFLTYRSSSNPFNHKELYEVMELCLSCKGCTSECPSNVDMATLKAEFLYQYYKSNGVPLRSKVVANIGSLNKLAILAPGLSNFFLANPATGGLLKKVLGIAPQRSMPLLNEQSLRRWFKSNQKRLSSAKPLKGSVFLFCDEFTNYQELHTGIATIELLSALGYAVEMPSHADSGRAHISKGLLEGARDCANENVDVFSKIVTADKPLIGIEPSAILGFRDEYPRLVTEDRREAARQLAPHALMLDEFLKREMEAGNIVSSQFTKKKQHILLHGHCHQKSLASVDDTAWVLGLPENYSVEVIPSGCCGMAGSFGFEKEHYDVSMQVGELVLFPAIRKAETDCIIVAPGASCRQQIADGTERRAKHLAEVLWEAIIK